MIVLIGLIKERLFLKKYHDAGGGQEPDLRRLLDRKLDRRRKLLSMESSGKGLVLW